MNDVSSRMVLMAIVLAGVGCKTPNKYVPTEGGVVEEPEGGAPALTADAAAVKLDAAASIDAVIVDVGSSPPMDTAPSASDGAGSPDMGPSPCTNGTARCAPSGTAVEMCTNGQWTTKETCPLTCAGAACTAVCTANVPCTQGIGPCRRGATTCAMPSSQPSCADVGVDDARGGCSAGNVCKSGACVPPCQGGVACSQGIGACRKGATFCASPTSAPVCNDSGADDSKGGCGGGQICKNGACILDPCAPKSSENLVPNAGFDSVIWPKWAGVYDNREWSPSDALGCPTSGSLRVGDDMSAGHVCVPVQPSTTYYLGYMVNRTGSDGMVGCGIPEWFDDAACTSSLDFGQTGNSPPMMGWQQVTAMTTSIAGAHSGVLVCFIVSTQPAYFDRVFVRATPGGF
jgi:hypothetical protein